MTVSLNPHNHIQIPVGLPVPVAAPAAWDVDVPAPVYWPPGIATGKAKLTTTVKHKSCRIALEGHDLGPLLIHVPVIPTPADILFAVHMLTSKRKMNFAAGNVQANQAPIACGFFYFPMTGCANPMSLPTAAPVTNPLNDVIVNMHWIDVLAGIVQIAADMVVDYLKSRWETPGLPPLGWRGAVKEAIPGSSFDPRAFAAETIGGNAGGLVRFMGRQFCSDYHGPAQFSVGVNQGVIMGSQLSVTTSDDGLQFQHQTTAAGGLVSQTTTVTRAPNGVWSASGAVTGAGFTGTVTESTPFTGTQNWL
jgi:hypothetical protein